MSDLSVSLAPANLGGWAYDPTRRALEIVTTDGHLLTWSLIEQRYVSDILLGGVTGAVDVSPDGQFAIVGDRQLQGGWDHFIRVNLATGFTEDFFFQPSSERGGVTDVAIGADNVVLITTGFGGASDSATLHSFNLTAAHPVDGVIAARSLRWATGMSVSDDHSLILVQEGDISNGPLHVYRSDAHAITANLSLYDVNKSGYVWRAGPGDINSVKNLAVQVTESSVLVFDTSLRLVKSLITYDMDFGAVGAAFSGDGNRLYVWQGPESHVVVYDTTSWQMVGTIEVSATTTKPVVGFFYSELPYQADVVSDGKFLVLNTGTSLEVIDIAHRLNTRLAAETMTGTGDFNSLTGGAGDDVITGAANAAGLLRGGWGADRIDGGGAFDNINGNQGADTEHGWGGGDWAVGGKGDDRLFGDDGDDVMNGNVGADTVDGGLGADIVRGGQGADLVLGGAGNDWLSGDLGDDTMTGGAGADTFHISRSPGYDRITDFHAEDGDRVLLDPGATYTLRQQGEDVVIFYDNYPVTLVGVQLSSLPPGWISQ